MVTPLPQSNNFLSGLQGFIDPRRQALLGLASGLLSSPNFGEALGTGFERAAQGKQYDDAYAAAMKKQAEDQARLNATVKWAQTQFPGQFDGAPPELIAEIAPKLYTQMKKGADPASLPANVQEWEYFSKLTPEQQSQYLTMKRSVPFLDRGTEYMRPDPMTGLSGPSISKDNFTPAYDAAAGSATAKSDAETKSALDSLSSKMPGLKSVVTELGDLADKATYTQTGQLWDNIVRETGQMPTEGALARTKYMAMVDNQVLPLLRDTFGAAFTVQEGESLRATLGAPDKSPAEKKAVLEAFIEQKARDLEALQSRVPSGAGDPARPDYKAKYGLE